MLASPLMHMVNGTMIEIDGGQEKAADGPRCGTGSIARFVMAGLCCRRTLALDRAVALPNEIAGASPAKTKDVAALDKPFGRHGLFDREPA